MLDLLRLKKELALYKKEKKNKKIIKEKENLKLKIYNMDKNDEFYDVYVEIYNNYETILECEKEIEKHSDIMTF